MNSCPTPGLTSLVQKKIYVGLSQYTRYSAFCYSFLGEEQTAMGKARSTSNQRLTHALHLRTWKHRRMTDAKGCLLGFHYGLARLKSEQNVAHPSCA